MIHMRALRKTVSKINQALLLHSYPITLYVKAFQPDGRIKRIDG
ncbi:MAG: hypothetical protein AB8B62_16390 [Roseobacter sp.]